MFSNDAAPTRANLHKRLAAADEAIRSAYALQQKRGDDLALAQALVGALGHLQFAEKRLAAAKGRRS